MFGPTADYWILLPLTHNRNLRTEQELNATADRSWSCDLNYAVARIRKLQHRLRGHFPISDNLTYLDVGCGAGDIAAGLASLGASYVTGVDITPRCIYAANANRMRLGLDDRLEFICEDIHRWTPPEKYDVVLSLEALEHIREPRSFLQRLRHLVKPEGIVVLGFGYLFHSPFGDHMESFFRVQIPWRGVLFSEQALLRLRRRQFRPTDQAESFTNISGGLNLLRYSDFLTYLAEAGWKTDILEVNPQLRKLPLLHSVSNALIRLPRLRDYFACSVYAVLRPDLANSQGAL